MSDFLKKIGWQEWVLLAAIIIVCFFQYSQISKFVQIPGPLYGGDLYFHYGHAMHLKEGGSVFESSHYLGEYESYPWLYHVIIAEISTIFGFSLFNVFIYSPVIMTILAGIIFYLLMFKITGNKTISLLSAILWMTINMPSAHPTTFALTVIFPFFVLSLAYAKSLSTRLLAGAAYGLCGLVHVTAFLGASLVLLLFFVYKIVEKNEKKDFFAKIKDQIIFFLPILVIGILIAMLYWWAPIFVYHGQTPNNWQYYAAGSQLNMQFLVSTFSLYFFNITGIGIFVVSLISLFGLYISVRNYKKFPLLFIVLLAAVIGTLHPIITEPLLGISFGYYRFPTIVLFPLSVMFFGIGLAVLFNSFKKANAKQIIFVVIVIILALNFFSVYRDYQNDQWTKVGKSQSQSMNILFKASDFIIRHTNVDEVVLAMNGESAFAVNALTGRKIVYMRATHASPYVDYNKRAADASIILYGNNTQLRNDLIKKYHVSYLFFDLFSAESVNICNHVWDQLDDPKYEVYGYYCIKTSPEYKQYLENNGIQTKTVYTRLDPASLESPKLNILFVKPGRLEVNFTIIDSQVIGNQTAYFLAKI